MKLQLLPARRGALWVRQGLRTFAKQPLALAGLFFLFMALLTLLSQIPLVGMFLAMLLLPGFTLGLMAASKEASLKRFPMPLVLLTAFRVNRQQTRSMLLLGLLYALGFLLAMGGSYLVDGGDFVRSYMAGQAPSREAMLEPGFQAAMWVFVGLHLPLSFMFWHAPALVHWYDQPPLKSLFFSLVACVRNFGAFAVFALSWLALLVLVLVGLSATVTLLGKPDLAGDLLFPILLLLACVFFSSLYFSFSDCFDFSVGH